MKINAITTVLMLLSISGFAQESKDTAAKPPGSPEAAFMIGQAMHKLKSNDAVLPRWYVDVNYRFGALNQTISMIDLSQAYASSLPTSYFVNPVFTDGKTNGGDINLGYFFNKRRNLGVSIGAMYLQHTGTMTVDSMYADYKNSSNDSVFRQIIHTNGPWKENVTITNFNIPIMLQFKHQFGKPSHPSAFGITAGIGGIFGISNQTTTNQASGSFSYEAVYKLSPDKKSIISGFETGTPNQNNDFVLSEAAYRAQHDGLKADRWVDSMRDQGPLFNVGLYKGIAESQRNGTKSYTEFSAGAIAQLGLSYALSYNVTFQLSGYAMYQTWTNKNNEGYTPTNKVISENSAYVVNYNSLTGGIKKSDYTAYGISAGFRIFFGEKRDVDGDGVPDAQDRCKFEYGEARFNGCPDTDGDGIVDDLDACKYEKGPEYTNGCPDRDNDGVADKDDACPDVYGELRNGCPVEKRFDTPVDTTLRTETGLLMAPHIVLETDVLYFDLAKTDLKDSSITTLNYVAKLLGNNPKVIVYLSGYTDDIGNYKNNLLLSYERSKNASNYLQNNKKIDARRIIISGNGMDNPVKQNDTPENRAKNRRVEIKLLLPLE
ncbi:MAG: OmpA family protein [Chitinophagaceae bacterium]